MYFLYFSKQINFKKQHFIQILSVRIKKSNIINSKTKVITFDKEVYTNIPELPANYGYASYRDQEIIVFDKDLFESVIEAKREVVRRAFE